MLPFTLWMLWALFSAYDVFTLAGGVKGVSRHIYYNFFSLFFFLIGFFFVVRYTAQLVFAVLGKYVNDFAAPQNKEGQKTGYRSESLLACARTAQLLLPYVAYLYVLVSGVFIIAWLYASAEFDAVRMYSMFYTDLDIRLFGEGVYARVIALFDSSWALSQFITWSYLGLSVVLGVTALILAMTSCRLFREFMLGFFLIIPASIPLWATISAVSPSQYLREGEVGEVAPEHQAIAHLTQNAVTSARPEYKEAIATLERMWEQSEGANSFAVSTNPSMHVAWGFLCVVYAFMVHRALGMVLVVYQLANMIGTVFLLQHYTIDAPLGVALMALVILVARGLIAYEERYMTVNQTWWFAGVILIREEVGKHVRILVADISRMWRLCIARMSR